MKHSLLQKSILMSSVLLANVAFADGNFSLDLRPSSGSITLEVSHDGNQVTGSVSPSRLSPFVNLQSVEAGAWQGQIGQQIASTELEDLGGGKKRVTISALPGGWYSYTLVTKSNGDLEVSGTGPQGNLNSAGVKKSGTEIYFNNRNLSFDLSSDSEGRFTGDVVSGTRNSGYGYLNVSGDLAPSVIESDPVLYILLYVLPFTR